MSHLFYRTDAWVLGSIPQKEADKLLCLFTREYGVVFVVAKGIRLLKSKLRYTMQDYSRARVDLVRTRGGWRLASAVSIDVHADIQKNLDSRRVLAGAFLLVRRLVAGEAPHPELFDDLGSMIHFLRSSGAVSTPMRDVEILSAVRILSALGYWSDEEGLGSKLARGNWSESLLAQVGVERQKIVSRVNSALRDTSL